MVAQLAAWGFSHGGKADPRALPAHEMATATMNDACGGAPLAVTEATDTSGAESVPEL